MRIRLKAIGGLRRCRAMRRTSGGFALMEVLIASLLLAILTVSLYGAFSFGFKVIKVSEEGVIADQVLTEQLEAIRICQWSAVTNGTVIPTNFTVVRDGTTFDGTLSISNSTATESYRNSLKQVTVGLTWTSGGGTRNRTMSSMISQYGIATYRP